MVELERRELNDLQVEDVRPNGRGPYSLHVGTGECVSIRGPSGSGKSLLLRAIADLDPHQGQVRLDAVDCKNVPAPQWRQQVALLPVESQWWLDEVGEHFSGDDCPWLEPLGFTSETLHWQVSRLSSGEKQRLALARMLMNRPRVLLLDEPTSSLDQQTTAAVEQVVKDYRQQTGAAVLWISHDAEQARRVADRQLQLSASGISQIDITENSDSNDTAGAA
jgi:putative ABC transport system ATP-binding protein